MVYVCSIEHIQHKKNNKKEVYFQADASFSAHSPILGLHVGSPAKHEEYRPPPLLLYQGGGVRPRRLSALPTAAHNGQHHKGSVIPSHQPDDTWQESQLTGKSHLSAVWRTSRYSQVGKVRQKGTRSHKGVLFSDYHLQKINTRAALRFFRSRQTDLHDGRRPGWGADPER